MPLDPGPGVCFTDVTADRHAIDSAVKASWHEIVRHGTFIGGPVVEAFEQEWAAYCSRRHAVGTANGTDALRIALQALGVGRGDEVVVPANTFIATAEAVAAAGAQPVFVDVDPGTLLVTPETVSAGLTPRTAAVVVVHLYGQMPDMTALGALCRRMGVALVEDAAQAHGATFCGRPAGSFGDVAAFSFYPTKNLGAYGDAGAVVTDEAVLASRMRSLGNHGRSPDDGNSHDLVGSNSRLDALQAAVLSAKLPLLETALLQRRRVSSSYDAGLRDVAVKRVEVLPAVLGAPHLYVIRVASRDEVRQALQARGIATGLHYPVPCHRQPAFADDVSLPVAEAAAGQLLSLPLYPSLSDEQVATVCAAVRAAVRPAQLSPLDERSA